jgi:hypothetical protein
MLKIIGLFMQICFFIKAPQDIPYSRWFFGLLLLINIAISLLVLSMSTGLFSSLLQVPTGIFLLLGSVYLILTFAGQLQRFYQTATALLGVDALISLFALPILGSTILEQEAAGKAYLILLALMIWHWAVTGHIFRHALSSSLSFGLGLSFLYFFVSYQIMSILFPSMS